MQGNVIDYHREINLFMRYFCANDEARLTIIQCISTRQPDTVSRIVPHLQIASSHQIHIIGLIGIQGTENTRRLID